MSERSCEISTIRSSVPFFRVAWSVSLWIGSTVLTTLATAGSSALQAGHLQVLTFFPSFLSCCLLSFPSLPSFLPSLLPFFLPASHKQSKDSEQPQKQKATKANRSLRKSTQVTKSQQKPAKTNRSEQQLPEATKSHQKPTKATRSHQNPTEANKSHQKPVKATRSQQKPTEASKSYQKPPEANRDT